MEQKDFITSGKLLDDILRMIRSFMDDAGKLEKLQRFISDELYQDLEDAEPEIPEKYRAVVREVADYLGAGMVFYERRHPRIYHGSPW